jgi:hypothetical protein
MSGEEHHLRYVPEPPGVSMTFVGWSAFGALVLLAVAIGGLYGIYHAVVPSSAPSAPQAFPPPQVNTEESKLLQRLRDEQSRRLEAWGWSDSQHSLIQIPIERAMQLLAKKGDRAYAPLIPGQAALSAPTAAAERATISPKGAQGDASASADEPSSEARK